MKEEIIKKSVIEQITSLCVAIGTIATACAAIYTQYSKNKQVSSTTSCADPGNKKK